MNDDDQMKAAVSVTEMAQMLGMSRSRFYQLVNEGVFHPPSRDTKARPFFPPEIQTKNLEIRAKNFGANNRPILFYARRRDIDGSMTRPSQRKVESEARPKESVDDSLLDDLKALGLDGITDAQVQSAVRVSFPDGISGIDESEVVREVYRHLKRQNSSDNVER